MISGRGYILLGVVKNLRARKRARIFSPQFQNRVYAPVNYEMDKIICPEIHVIDIMWYYNNIPNIASRLLAILGSSSSGSYIYSKPPKAIFQLSIIHKRRRMQICLCIASYSFTLVEIKGDSSVHSYCPYSYTIVGFKIK